MNRMQHLSANILISSRVYVSSYQITIVRRPGKDAIVNK